MTADARAAKSKTKTPEKINIIYFRSRGRTKRLVIKLGFARLMMTGCVLAVIWAVFSPVVIALLFDDQRQLQEELASSRFQLFSYQVRYEDIFQDVYATQRESDDSLVSSTNDPEESPASTNSIENRADKEDTTSLLRSTLNESAPVPTDHEQPNRSNPSDNTTLHVAIKGSYQPRKDGTIEINYTLKNQRSPNPVSGLVWFVMEYDQDEGTQSQQRSPTATDEHPPSRFKIRNFKRETLQLPMLNEPQQLELRRVVLYISDRQQTTIKWFELKPQPQEFTAAL